MSDLPDPVTQSNFYDNVAGKRFLAWIVDMVLVLVLCFFAVPLSGFIAVFFLPLMWLVVDFAYRTITISNYSATLGMRLVSIELRNSSGARLSATEAAQHTFGYFLSFAFFLLQVLSIILMCSSLRGQSLTDHALGTVMLNRQARR